MTKRFVFDITHPSYVHLYKNIIKKLKNNGDEIHILAQDDNAIINLLDQYELETFEVRKKSQSLVSKGFNQFILDFKMHNLCKKLKADYAIGGSITVAQGTYFTDTKSFIFTDDDGDVVPLFSKSTYPFADIIVHPECIRDEINSKQIKINSYKELAYLHPNNFKPQSKILDLLNLKKEEKYFIVRFSALQAHHDYFKKGIKHKLDLINLLDNNGRVFITSEGELPRNLKQYELNIDEKHIHSLLYYADLYVGDSQTMAAEAAVLGVPSFRCNSFVGRLSYLNELETKYNLTFGFKPEDEKGLYEKIESVIINDASKDIWERRKRKMLSEKIDLTNWFYKYFNNQI